MRGTRLGIATFTVVGLAALAARCQIYTPSLLESGEAGVDGGDGIGWWSGAVDGGCFSAGEPHDQERPRPQPPGDVGPIYVALRTVRLGGLSPDGQPSDTAWQDIGLDLDGVCTASNTCAGDPSHPDVSCKPTGDQVAGDGNYCRDNTFGRLQVVASKVGEVASKYGLSDDAFNCGLCVGAYNFVIKVSGYNGTDNDDEVRVDLYPSPGVQGDILPWDCHPGSDWRQHPCFWDSDIPLTVQEGSTVSPIVDSQLPDAKISDPFAYVRQGYIVITLPPDTLFWLPGKRAPATTFPLVLHSGLVTGHVSRAPNGTWQVDDGIIAGRARAPDIVHGFRQIGFCENDSTYGLMTQYLQTNLDILASGDVDPNTTCDAISVGLAFTGVEVEHAGAVPVAPLVECAFGTGDAGLDGGAAKDASKDAPGGG